MKVAVAGKGGSGKTTVSGTLARLFAADGYDVLAIDDDDDPNLGVSLGAPRDVEVRPLPADLVTRHDEIQGDTSYELTRPADEVVDEYAVQISERVRLMESVEIAADSCSIPMGHIAVSLALSGYDEDPEEVVVLDMAAHVDYLGVANDVDAILLVGQPSYSSLETVRKMYVVARGVGIPEIHILANSVRTDRDLTMFEEYCSDRSLDVSAVIPHDDAVARAEREGTALIDHDGESPAVRAIREVGEDLLASHGPRPAQ